MSPPAEPEAGQEGEVYDRAASAATFGDVKPGRERRRLGVLRSDEKVFVKMARRWGICVTVRRVCECTTMYVRFVQGTLKAYVACAGSSSSGIRDLSGSCLKPTVAIDVHKNVDTVSKCNGDR